MARYKNAGTKYEVGSVPSSSSGTTTYYELAKFIQTVEANDNEEVETEGFYDGDGNPEDNIMSYTSGYSFSGYDDPDDSAQMLIRGLKHAVGDGRKVMFRVTETGTGAKSYEGKATVKNIVSGSAGGDATAFATFSCDITFDGTPTITTVTGG